MSTFPQVEMRPVFGVSHYLADMFYEMFFRGVIAGRENLPASGGCIVAVNHASYLDAFIIGSQLPRQVTFFGRKTLWTAGFQGWWLSAVGVIPVDRDGGSDVTAMRKVLHVLKDGGMIIVFPEGTRTLTGALQPPKPGVGLFACRSQVPVVPARIFGSFEASSKGGKVRHDSPVTVVFDRPMLPVDYDSPADGKERYQIASERIMARIAALRRPAERIV
jgi:1-acyl-sn-glycerol-3-phosphate acyltransferase